MNILYNAFPTHCRGGGAVVKLRKLRQYLRQRGHTVDLYDPWTTEIGNYEIYHHFSWYAGDLPVIRFAKAEGAKVVLETMYWASLRHALQGQGPAWHTRARATARYLRRRLTPMLDPQRRVLLEADLLVANSELEADLLVRHFGLEANRILVAPNGVDPAFGVATPDLFVDRFGVSDFVLATGMFEARKNQLTLIRALAGTGLRLVLIGSCPAVHRWYYDQCRAEADSSVLFLDAIDHDDPLLASAYSAARVLAMPSWHETTGKSALEAALAGTHVVMTTFAPAAREYLGDLVSYVDPGDVPALRAAVLELWDAAPNRALRERVSERFLWPHVVGVRERAYRGLLGSDADERTRDPNGGPAPKAAATSARRTFME